MRCSCDDPVWFVFTHFCADDWGGVSGGDASPETDRHQGSSSLYDLAISHLALSLLPNMQTFCLVRIISYIHTQTHTLHTPLIYWPSYLILFLYKVVWISSINSSVKWNLVVVSLFCLNSELVHDTTISVSHSFSSLETRRNSFHCCSQ